MYCSGLVSAAHRLLRTIVKTEGEAADPPLSSSLSMDEWDLLKSIIREEDPIPTASYAGQIAATEPVEDAGQIAATEPVEDAQSAEEQTDAEPESTEDKNAATQLAKEAAEVAEVVAESHTKACQELDSMDDNEEDHAQPTTPTTNFGVVTEYISAQYGHVRKWARVETLIGIALGLVVGGLWNRYNVSMRIQRQDAKIKELLGTVRRLQGNVEWSDYGSSLTPNASAASTGVEFAQTALLRWLNANHGPISV